MSRVRASGAATIALAAVFALAPSAAASPPVCASVPELVDVVPGEAVAVSSRAFEVDVRRIGDADPGNGLAPVETAVAVAVDLRARFRHPASGGAVPGTLLPGVDAVAVVPAHDGSEVAAPMRATGTDGGPVLRALAALPANSGPQVVRVDVHDRGVVGLPCPAGTFSLRLTVDPDALAAPGPGSAASVDEPEDDRNLIEVSNADPRSGGVYTDVWGYDDGTTQLAILGHSTGTLFLDVTDPVIPVEVAFIGGPDSPFRDIKTYDTYAYVVTRGTGPGAGLQIVDLSDPSAPALANTFDAAFAFAQNLWIDEVAGLAWVVGTDVGVSILDLTDPVNPVEIARWTDRYVHDAFVADGWAYFAEIGAGLVEIVDASDPAAGLTVTASWPTPSGVPRSIWVHAGDAVAAIGDEVAGGPTSLYDVTSKTGPNPRLGTYAPDADAVVANVQFDDRDDDLLTVTQYGLGFRIVDAAQPSAPVEWAAYDTFPSADAGFAGAVGQYNLDPIGFFYVADSDTGLYMLQPSFQGGTVAGVVSDAATGNPIPGARVVAPSDGTSRITGDDGRYGLYAEGELAIRASAWGYRPTFATSPPVPPGGRETLDLTLEPLPTVALTGTVTLAGSGAPIPGVTVRVVGSDLETVTGADGGYAFAAVPAGQRTVTAHAFGHASGEGRVELRAGAPSVMDLTLSAAAFADDFESDLGWTAAEGEDPADTGRWERGEPEGTAGGTVQTDVDATPDPGTDCYVTGNLPGADVEDDDVATSATTLVSPAVDATAFPAVAVRYQRWVSTTAGILSGGFLEVEVSSDDGATWTVLEAPSGLAGAWIPRSFDVGGRTPITANLRIRFVADPAGDETDETDRVLEAAVDDVEWVEACFARFHPDAADIDGDGRVDACDPCPADGADDLDGDGVCGDVDNAPAVANVDQADGDGDGVGDVVDLCPSTSDPAQRDADGDGLGDACDPDMDGDGLEDGVDPDDDGDGVADPSDVCPRVADATQSDRDEDGVGDACDADDGEVRGVRLDGDRLRWEAEDDADAYHVYRGELLGPAAVAAAGCRIASVTGTSAFDLDVPDPGDGRFYLVSRVAAGQEGSLGTASDGAERGVDDRCP